VVVKRNDKVCVAGQCQNWSKRAGGGEENLRAMICAPEGYTFIGADQKQLEARLIGAMSQCQYLLDVFKRGEDVHSAFAAVGFPEVWPKLAAAYKAHKGREKCGCVSCAERDRVRDLTKRMEYGVVYGGSDKAIWEALVGDFPALTQQQVRVFIAKCNEILPEVMLWREQTLREAVHIGEIRSPILGRRQVFPLGRVDPTVAYNYKAQSGGADLWALGALDFCARWNQTNQVDVRLTHNGHDSVLVLCRRDLAPQVERDVYECWSREWAEMPFEMETKIADRWSAT
jgi:DNA polymerase I-like protein with 3'-5' exonuclease and polymerase domains